MAETTNNQQLLKEFQHSCEKLFKIQEECKESSKAGMTAEQFAKLEKNISKGIARCVSDKYLLTLSQQDLGEVKPIDLYEELLQVEQALQALAEKVANQETQQGLEGLAQVSTCIEGILDKLQD